MTQGIVAETLYQIGRATYGEGSCFRMEQREWKLPRLGESGCKLVVSSYLDGFRLLWGIEEGGLRAIAKELVSRSGELTLAVIWDGIPGGDTYPVATARYLTPIDWAVALSCYIYRMVRSQRECPELRILVLDLASQNVSEADSVQFTELSPRRDVVGLPWVRLFRPASQTTWAVENLLANLKGSRFAESGMSDEAVPSMRAAKLANIEIVCRLWIGTLLQPTDPTDRHAIANILGPQLLLQENSSSDLHVKALRAKIEALGLVPDANDHTELGGKRSDDPRLGSTSAWIEPPVAQLHSRPLRVLLVDDQWHQGWGEVLVKAFGGAYTYDQESGSQDGGISNLSRSVAIEVDAVRDIREDEIRKRLFLDGKDHDHRFQIEYDLVFLDLRLFTGIRLAEEARFFEELLALAKHFRDGGNTNLPWRGFSTPEIERLEKWIRRVIEGDQGVSRLDDAYYDGLTLLPRILALRDLSLPIVLFSSTGERKIVDSLSTYENIITEFEKPRFWGPNASSDLVRQARVRFRAAVDRALMLLTARERCRSLYKWKASGVGRTPDPGMNPHIELFIDESESEATGEFSVGGCFAIFPNEDQAISFNDSLVRDGIRYFNGLGQGPYALRAAIKKKKEPCGQELKRALSQDRGGHKVVLRPLRLRVQPGERTSSIDDPLGLNELDNRFRSTLKALIEIFLFESIPVLHGLAEGHRCSISLFAGTRMVKVDDQKVRSSMMSRYGYEPHSQDPSLLYSFQRGQLWSLIDDLLRARAISREIVRAVAVKLPYEMQPNGEDAKTKLPEYLVCATAGCGGTVKIGPGDVTERIGGSIPGTAYWGQVVNVIDRGFFIRYADPSMGYRVTNLYASKRELSPKKGNLVAFGAIEVRDGKKEAKNVTVFNNRQRESYEKLKSNVTRSLAQDVVCPNGCPQMSLRPDYRALHYVADELLSRFPSDPESPYRELVDLTGAGCFDDQLDRDLEQLLTASRSLDRGDIVDAVVNAYPVDENAHEWSAGRMILTRIASKLDLLHGSEFARIGQVLKGRRVGSQ